MGSEELFRSLGYNLANHNSSSEYIGNRRFRAIFGITPKVCAICWEKLKESRPPKSKPIHLLWALMFMKKYDTEHGNHMTTCADEKTFRKWSWKFVFLLADLNVINWESRFEGAADDSDLFVSLDGTDCRIMEPAPFNRKWYSHKFKGPGLRYEIGLSVSTAKIVWVHGGYPCGLWPDLKLSRQSYCVSVRPGEKTLADRGYRDNRYFIQPRNAREKTIMARHETINRRIKQFNILSQKFRHSLYRHPRVFHACVHLTQLMVENEDQLFLID